MRLGAFVAERHPLALGRRARCVRGRRGRWRARRRGCHRSAARALRRELAGRLESRPSSAGLPETTPGTSAQRRASSRPRRQVVDDCDGFLRRAAIEASLTHDERIEILRGMVLTRATDNRLKTFFTSGEVRYRRDTVSGKGISLARPGGHLRRGDPASPRPGVSRRRWPVDGRRHRADDPRSRAALAMRCDPETVRMVLNAQMAKAGPPLDGKDLHIGDFDWGILPPAAPLAIATLTIAGMAMASSARARGASPCRSSATAGRRSANGTRRSTSARSGRLPAIFCVQNNQTALSTPIADQSAARVFADKAAGYGIPGHHDRRHRSRSRSPRRSPGPPSGRARATGPR